MRSTKIKKIVSGPLIIFVFCVATIEQFYNSLFWGHNNWCMTECLINYAGGFVRRGLPGELALSASSISGISPNVIIVIACFLLLVGLILFYCRKITRKMPAFLIFSPIVLGIPAFNDFLVRKDTLCMAILILCLIIEKTKCSILLKNILINLLGITAILSHEGFIFYGFLSIIAYRYFRSEKKLINIIISFSPMILTFAISSIYHGDELTALAINKSLISVWHSIDPSDKDINFPSCAITSLKYSLTNCPWMGYSVLSEISYHIYTPIAWLATIIICYGYLLEFIVVNPSETNGVISSLEVEKSRLFVILTAQLIFISPLFMIGWDYGRWIFLWTASSLAIYLLGLNWNDQFLLKVTTYVAGFQKKIRLPWTPQKWHLLFFGIPVCSWSVFNYLHATPLGNQVDFIYQALFHKTFFNYSTFFPLK
jgi:hypothetical protein